MCQYYSFSSFLPVSLYLNFLSLMSLHKRRKLRAMERIIRVCVCVCVFQTSTHISIVRKRQRDLLRKAFFVCYCV